MWRYSQLWSSCSCPPLVVPYSFTCAPYPFSACHSFVPTHCISSLVVFSPRGIFLLLLYAPLVVFLLSLCSSSYCLAPLLLFLLLMYFVPCFIYPIISSIILSCPSLVASSLDILHLVIPPGLVPSPSSHLLACLALSCVVCLFLLPLNAASPSGCLIFPLS